MELLAVQTTYIYIAKCWACIAVHSCMSACVAIRASSQVPEFGFITQNLQGSGDLQRERWLFWTKAVVQKK